MITKPSFTGEDDDDSEGGDDQDQRIVPTFADQEGAEDGNVEGEAVSKMPAWALISFRR